ncbi:DUF1289 domain-containing protein [Herminiimonas contaminans]|uniref:DUF1289 domain-containing protein n=1 Tax=Herminiimonas contaminans TaxID=1111140 RepID=UPI001E519EDC|nr:DUF1289 domain-containing protein [Herminiimonas contaminans]
MSKPDNPEKVVNDAVPANQPADKPRNTLRPDSPCAGYCSTSHGDEICKGCGRTFDEVINWIIYDDEEKAAVWARLEAAGLVKR